MATQSESVSVDGGLNFLLNAKVTETENLGLVLFGIWKSEVGLQLPFSFTFSLQKPF